ncbi:TrkH family potassium uptake protein [Coriobacteriia bacterium Es71-Z0120]|uniref:TrkH family potassium uptake protein n=1 Tax=Parvivirga hydrogeniphila TaxID=2939460 RepID=UPI002260B7C9|nr:TrkH family potassium uptake protein [Parvivirga hydrogeniphila]MCL4078386.1 TrkH family potassium uptake protein [Parvivirga hydrogeniphila]
MWVHRTRDDVRVIARYLGMLVVGIGLLMAVPLVTALALGEWGPALDYFAGAGLAIGFGSVLMLAAPRRASLNASNGLIVTALGWLFAALCAAVPLVLSGHYGSYLDALFESMSSLTTSGLTLVQDLDHLANAHNMWRHLMHLVGGQGIVVAVLSFALAHGGGAVSLYLAEARDERIMPNVIHTVRFIWFVTAVYVLLGTTALSILNLIRGMDAVRATLHAFWVTVATFDTGGFGPQSQNALYYHSAWFEWVTVMLMLAGTFNFNLHADIWRGDRRELFKNTEVRTLALNIFVLSVLVSGGLASTQAFGSGFEVVRKGIYHILSANTGTGHQTLYAAQWMRDYGGLGFVAVVLAMAFGGMASSTAGGIKSLRVGLIVKGVVRWVKAALAPPSAIVTARFHHMKQRVLQPEMLASALMIATLYVFTYVTGAVVGVACGYGVPESVFESVSAAANVGLSTGITSPSMPSILKITYILQMWAGRLEFIALFVLVATLLQPVLGWRRR